MTIHKIPATTPAIIIPPIIKGASAIAAAAIAGIVTVNNVIPKVIIAGVNAPTIAPATKRATSQYFSKKVTSDGIILINLSITVYSKPRPYRGLTSNLRYLQMVAYGE